MRSIGRDDLRVVRTAALGIRFLRVEGVVAQRAAGGGSRTLVSTLGRSHNSRYTTPALQ